MRVLSKLFAAVAVTVLVASCGTTGMGSQAGTSMGTANGQASGAALKSLYSQYKTDGKVNMQDMNNVMNIMYLVNAIQGLKGMDNKSAFYTDFATGLVLGSNNMISSSNSSAVTGMLGTLANANMPELTQAAKQAASKSAGNLLKKAIGSTDAVSSITEKTAGVANTLSTLNTIFGMMK